MLILVVFLAGSVGVVQAQWWWNQGDYPGVLAPKQNIVALGVERECMYPSEGWMCQDVRYGATGYEFEIRYNMAGLNPSEHVIFAAGSYFSSLSRSLGGSDSLQDILAGQNIRSYDVQIMEYEANNPIVGAPNSSVMVAALVDYISNHYAGGKKVKMITYDYATTLTSYALAYHNLESKVNEVILLGGPAGFNYKYELYNLAAPSYISAADRAIKIDGWTILDAINWINGWQSIPHCTYMNWIWDLTSSDHCEGQVELDVASMFSDNNQTFTNVDLLYPGVEIHNIIGSNDVKWFKDSSKYWYDKISPKAKTRDVMPGVDHFVYESNDVINKILERLGIVGVNINNGIIPDATSPTKPTAIILDDKTNVLGGITPPSVAITPQGSKDNVKVHHYEVYRNDNNNNTYIGDAYPGVAFRDWSVAGETKYDYTVKAVDTAGNKSVVSDAFSITTGKLPANPAAPISNDEIPWIESTDTYQMGNDQAFSIYDHGVLTCVDNKDGGIKSNITVTHNIPANPPAGTYQITIDCTDSDGNKAATKTAQVVVVDMSVPVVAPNPNPQPNPNQPAAQPPANGKPDLSWLYGAAKPAGAATPGGLVPCGDEGEPSCQFCHGIDLLENVLDWLVKVLTAIATIIFVYAGVRMVTSVGNASAKQDAKKLIINAATGLVIVLAAWLFIDILLQSLLGANFQGPWDDIQCVVQPVPIK